MSDQRFYRHHGLALRWWLFFAGACLPWLLLANLPELYTLPSMALFIAGLVLYFFALPGFAPYKKALWAMQETDLEGEDARWKLLADRQRAGLCLASLPAWWAALASPFGLDGPAGILLVLGSLITLWVFRIPDQVLLP